MDFTYQSSLPNTKAPVKLITSKSIVSYNKASVAQNYNGTKIQNQELP